MNLGLDNSDLVYESAVSEQEGDDDNHDDQHNWPRSSKSFEEVVNRVGDFSPVPVGRRHADGDVTLRQPEPARAVSTTPLGQPPLPEEAPLSTYGEPAMSSQRRPKRPKHPYRKDSPADSWGSGAGNSDDDA